MPTTTAARLRQLNHSCLRDAGLDFNSSSKLFFSLFGRPVQRFVSRCGCSRQHFLISSNWVGSLTAVCLYELFKEVYFFFHWFFLIAKVIHCSFLLLSLAPGWQSWIVPSGHIGCLKIRCNVLKNYIEQVHLESSESNKINRGHYEWNTNVNLSDVTAYVMMRSASIPISSYDIDERRDVCSTSLRYFKVTNGNLTVNDITADLIGQFRSVHLSPMHLMPWIPLDTYTASTRAYNSLVTHSLSLNHCGLGRSQRWEHRKIRVAIHSSRHTCRRVQQDRAHNGGTCCTW